MIVMVMTFSEQGSESAHRLFDAWEEATPVYFDGSNDRKAWLYEAFSKHLPVLFVGALGIAVRLTAPYVRDKLKDSPVIVMDERAGFVIPVLSGHMGGANELAWQMAKAACAQPVFTTATDVEGVWAADVFARRNGFAIRQREGIRKISEKLLLGEMVTAAIDERLVDMTEKVRPQEKDAAKYDARYVTICADGRRLPAEKTEEPDIWITADKKERDCTLQLMLKPYVLGMGCKSGKTFEELCSFAERTLDGAHVDMEDVCGLGSIDIKGRERGLLELAAYHHLAFETFSAETLMALPGDFSESEFVRKVTGADNVCERSALALAGEGGELVVRKCSEDGMTLAVAGRRPAICTWDTAPGTNMEENR